MENNAGWDSITEGGSGFPVYRDPLRRKLADAGFCIDFVGSRRDSAALSHEGHGGRNTQFLSERLAGVLARHPADIVLIHSGHNSFAEDKPVAGIVACTEQMIADARAANPSMIELLAQVITSGKLPKYSYIPELNRELTKLAERLNTPEQPVIIVDQATGFDPETDTPEDKVHPNAQGAAKMADLWFTALTRILPGP